MIRDGAANYYVKYFFIGTDGWSERTGFTSKDQIRAQAVRNMTASAQEAGLPIFIRAEALQNKVFFLSQAPKMKLLKRHRIHSAVQKYEKCRGRRRFLRYEIRRKKKA